MYNIVTVAFAVLQLSLVSCIVHHMLFLWIYFTRCWLHTLSIIHKKFNTGQNVSDDTCSIMMCMSYNAHISGIPCFYYLWMKHRRPCFIDLEFLYYCFINAQCVYWYQGLATKTYGQVELMITWSWLTILTNYFNC